MRAIAVHGGAGHVPDEMVEAHKKGYKKAIEKGWDLLKNGGTALDAASADPSDAKVAICRLSGCPKDAAPPDQCNTQGL